MRSMAGTHLEVEVKGAYYEYHVPLRTGERFLLPGYTEQGQELPARSQVAGMSPTSPQARGFRLLAAMSQVQLERMDNPLTVTTATFIGIVVAITGNVLISLALNLQKLAHKRIEAKTLARQKPSRQNGKVDDGPSKGRRERTSEGGSLDQNDENRLQRHPEENSRNNNTAETQSLLSFLNTSSSPILEYGATLHEQHNFSERPSSTPSNKTTLASQRLPSAADDVQSHDIATLPVDTLSEESALNQQASTQKLSMERVDLVEESNETEYLRSKLWWLGFLLMNVGEIGNFISYAWAPASVVAPLGTFALIANCVFAPVILGEHFRKRDLFGIIIAIIGAVTVVLASNAADVRLDPDALIRAIRQTAFIVFSGIYVGGAIILAILSHTSIGRRWVFVDVGLCALFGGFTVLSTKAISTLLTMQWIDMFTKWITYPVLVVLVFTGVGQIRYVNRALIRFDSKVVIPVQFVLFTLSAIIGSAILYGDFRKATFHQILTFLYGCAATFLGVFIIAWAPSSADDDEEEVEQGDVSSPAPQSILGRGSIGRRKQATLILPSGVKDSPTVRHQHSINLIGLSPAQHLLLVHTPPRDVPIQFRDRGRDRDVERELRTPDSAGRRRTISLFTDHPPGSGSPNRTRDSSVGGRPRNGTGAPIGSFDQEGSYSNAHA